MLHAALAKGAQSACLVTHDTMKRESQSLKSAQLNLFALYLLRHSDTGEAV